MTLTDIDESDPGKCGALWNKAQGVGVGTKRKLSRSMVMKLRDVMTTTVDGISPSDDFAAAARKMADLNVGSLPVLDAGKLVGVVTDRDLVVRGLAKGGGSDTEISAAMTREVVTCAPDTDTHAASKMMGERQIRRLFVCDGEKLVGVVALGDLAVETKGADAGAALKEISRP